MSQKEAAEKVRRGEQRTPSPPGVMEAAARHHESVCGLAEGCAFPAFSLLRQKMAWNDTEGDRVTR